VGFHPLFALARCIYNKYSQSDYNTITKKEAIAFAGSFFLNEPLLSLFPGTGAEKAGIPGMHFLSLNG
jgi:hypothetical protein